jgi:hypothetical protein
VERSHIGPAPMARLFWEFPLLVGRGCILAVFLAGNAIQKVIMHEKIFRLSRSAAASLCVVIAESWERAAWYMA